MLSIYCYLETNSDGTSAHLGNLDQIVAVGVM